MIRYAEFIRAMLDAIEATARDRGLADAGSAIELRVRVYDTATSVVTDEVVVRTTVTGGAKRP